MVKIHTRGEWPSSRSLIKGIIVS